MNQLLYIAYENFGRNQAHTKPKPRRQFVLKPSFNINKKKFIRILGASK